MPSAIARMATIFLGTEKLQLQLEEGLGGDTQTPSQQFMRFAILSDLMVDNLPDSAQKVATVLKDYRFLSHVFGRKLWEIALRFRLPEQQLEQIRSLVGDTMMNLSGLSHEETSKKKSKVIQALQRERLLIEYDKKRKS
jgi:hypothetical protein